MKVIVLADIHLDFKKAHKILNSEDFDCIFIAGDLGLIPYTEDAIDEITDFLKEIAHNFSSIYVVLGNHDSPKLLSLRMDHVKIISSGIERFSKDVSLLGLSGTYSAPLTYNLFPISENYIYRTLKKLRKNIEGKFILLIHEPPYSSRISLAMSGKYIGSKGLFKFIGEERPFLCVCGHIHEGRGIDRIGDTLLVNPGPAYDGYYAIIKFLDRGVNVELKRIKE